MLVEQVWTGNSYRNFNYLIACPETGEALAIDPLDFRQCLTVAKDKGWNITQIVNTHEHSDHIGGNRGLVKATGAQIIAHERAGERIPNMDRGVGAGDVIKVGKTVELECLDTPGHTMMHVCLLSRTEQPALFSGDTLFNAGAGNCHNGGHPEQMYDTYEQQLELLGDNTLIYPGHDYLLNNLAFTLDREPDNLLAAEMLERYKNQDPDDALITTMADEKAVNTFFRLQSATVIEKLVREHPDMGDNPDAKSVFLKLRELRNSW
ncbi:MAG: hydroxyacylglutathione hydrolase [Gammaproteobacteria bacterium]|nr:hydroxyacylglutathione hydrolase [Gammaproteobacteria bacterium]